MRIENAEQAKIARLMLSETEARSLETKHELVRELATLLQLGKDLLASLEAQPDAVAHLASRVRTTTLNIDRGAIAFNCHRDALTSIRLALFAYDSAARKN